MARPAQLRASGDRHIVRLSVFRHRSATNIVVSIKTPTHLLLDPPQVEARPQREVLERDRNLKAELRDPYSLAAKPARCPRDGHQGLAFLDGKNADRQEPWKG